MANSKDSEPLVKLGAVWENTDRNGNIYYAGKIGDARLVILRNKFKESDKHPDMILYVQNHQKKEGEGKSGGARSDAGANNQQPPLPEDLSTEDIPF